MALQAGGVVFLFLCTLFFLNGAAQPTVNEAWTIEYTIAWADPSEVDAKAKEVNAAVQQLTQNIADLAGNLTASNSTDFQTLYGLLDDITALSSNITTIRAEYDSLMQQLNGTNFTTALDQFNQTLQCFAASNCVTEGPTTPPYTGPTTPNLCMPNPCQNGGSCNPGGTCTCAPFYTGTHCESVTCYPSTGVAVTLNATQTMTFPPDPFPGALSGLNCSWRIRSPPGYYVDFTINNVTFVNSGGLFDIIDTFNGQILFSTDVSTTGPGVSNKTSRNLAEIDFLTTAAGVSGLFEVTLSAELSNPCSSNPCVNGTCQANGFVAECKCYPCWTGPRCDVDEGDPCAPIASLCQHGNCTFDQDTCTNPRCKCDDGYTGPLCNQIAPTTGNPFRHYKLYDMPDTEE